MRHLGLPQSFYPLLDLSHTFPPRRSTRLAKDVLPDKNEDAWTTSSRFKLDLVEPCWPSIYPLEVILEVGAHLGHCTRVLSRLFQTVLALEHSPHVLKQNALRNADLKNVAPCD